MSVTQQIGGVDTERIFIGTDWTKAWKVADYDADSSGATAKNIAGWAITFDIRSERKSASSKITPKTVGSGLAISGVFNSVLASSTQVVTLTIADTDITAELFGASGGSFYYSLKRTDDGAEAILAEGKIVIQRATQD